METVNHECEEQLTCYQEKIPEGFYGDAITHIFVSKNSAYAENGEYCSAIAYCPFCGVKLVKEKEC